MEKETLHTIQVLQSAKKALNDKDSQRLDELSNQTIHSACGIQDSGSLTTVVLIYSLAKLLESHSKIKNFNRTIKKINTYLNLAIKALRDERIDKYESYLAMARRSLSSTSISIKPFIQEILRKASINKASKLYEHGLSLGKTSELLGITQWELAEYTGQKIEVQVHTTIKIKDRAKLAWEFFK